MTHLTARRIAALRRMVEARRAVVGAVNAYLNVIEE